MKNPTTPHKPMIIRFPCCVKTIQEADDALLTRNLYYCLRRVLSNPKSDIQLLANIGETIQEMYKREITLEYVASRIEALSKTWNNKGELY